MPTGYYLPVFQNSIYSKIESQIFSNIEEEILKEKSSLDKSRGSAVHSALENNRLKGYDCHRLGDRWIRMSFNLDQCKQELLLYPLVID